MKDLELTDILARERTTYTKLSIFLNGSWQFASLVNPVLVDENQSIFKVIYKFGLVKSTETNPGKFTVLGEPGDYVGLDGQGEISLIKKAEFASRYPKKNLNPRTGPDTSTKLNNPNYITEIVKGSRGTISNTTPTTTYTPSTGGSSGGTSGGSSGGGGGGY